MIERPYIAQRRGFFFVVWATAHDAPYTRDRNFSARTKYHEAEIAFQRAYGVTPQPYGVGF